MRGESQPGRLHPFQGVLRIVEPRVADRLVPDEGEFIVDEVHHHWVVYVPRALEGLLALGLLLLASVVPIHFALVLIVAALALLARAVSKGLASYVDRFVITNLRVFRSWGLVSQRLATMPISRILDIAVVKPVLGRFLGYGHFVFESAAQDQGLRDIRFVPRPFDRDLTMQRVIQRTGLRKAMEGPLGNDDPDDDGDNPAARVPGRGRRPALPPTGTEIIPPQPVDPGPYGRARAAAAARRSTSGAEPPGR